MAARAHDVAMEKQTQGLSRRQLLQAGSLALASTVVPSGWSEHAGVQGALPLQQFGYGDVVLRSPRHEEQREHAAQIMMGVSDDSLLKPFRQMVGLPAPGEDLGGWYHYDPDWEPVKGGPGFAPGHLFGQWVSALARNYAISGDTAMRDKVVRLNRAYAATIQPAFYTNKNRFPAYCFDKLVCGLIDSHSFGNDPDAFAILDRTVKAAAPNLPGKALDRDLQCSWRPCPNPSWAWDEPYTLPENLFLAYQRGAGAQYRTMATAYLDDRYFEPLSRGEDTMAHKHAYSYVNALNSAMQAHFVNGSAMHLKAAQNAFAMLLAQSYATGGWGPDEGLIPNGSDQLGESLKTVHHSFETPCGSYAHFKITRYLLRATGDSRYGDSMERVMYNTVLGAKKLEADGHAFYYSDYSFQARRFYHDDRWPCCAGTLPQVSADYRINSYFRGPRAVYVNLYLPSTLKWTEGGAQLELTQSGEYPLQPQVSFELKASRPVEMALHFRIPAWAEGASLRINGKLESGVVPGRFAVVSRAWKDGDRVELELPLTLRLEAVDKQHADTVALLRGPLALMAITENAPAVSRTQLLAARQTGANEWEVQTGAGPLAMVPFTDVGEREYSLYLKAV